MYNLYNFLTGLLSLYQLILFVWVILGWMQAYNALPYNQFVHTLMNILYRLTEPVLRPIRSVLPTLGGLDFSPFIAMIAIQLIKVLLADLLF